MFVRVTVKLAYLIFWRSSELETSSCAQAVLVRVATDSLWTEGATDQDTWIARQHSNIIVIAILLTTTLGSVLTTVLGPILLSNDSKVAPKEFYKRQPLPSPDSTDIKHHKSRVSFQFIDA